MCCFRKALYSLKQSPRAWLAKSDVVLGKILLSMWMIYYYGDKLKELLQHQFCTEELSRLRYFLGIEVAR